MTSKLHINLSIGLIEVEGSEELVRDIYADFQKNLTSHTGLQLETDTPKGNTENKSGAAKSKSKAADKPKTTKKSGSSGEQLDVVSEFFNNSKPFLNEISKFEMPKGHQQRVLLFIYIMQKIGMKNITLNHVYTCYRLLTIPTPTILRQTLTDAKNKKVWLNLTEWDDIKAHHKGEEYVEQHISKKTE